MNVLLIGGGGREHALAKKIKESHKLTEFYAIPGNPGIAQVAEVVDVPFTIENIISCAKEKKIDLIVCGPEQALVDGLSDKAEKEGILVFGPSAKGARLEGSKIFSKEFMMRYNIPTSPFCAFDNYDDAKAYIDKRLTYPVVIKADGLAAGKGVKISGTREEALAVLKEFMMDKTMGDAGNKIIVEDFMTGEEMSAFFFTDGKRFLPLIAAKDYKKAYDGDKGENTGGMGCYAPHSKLSDELLETITTEVIGGVKEGFNKENIDYRGILYVGLMLTSSGPKVVEFNCRFGDPEAQVLLPLMENDILDIFYAAAKGNLEAKKLKWKNDYCACVVIASGGYPAAYEKGRKIDFGLLSPYEFVHAGTKMVNGEIVNNGGRVLNAVALGPSKSSAIYSAYHLAKQASFEGSFFRNDIGS